MLALQLRHGRPQLLIEGGLEPIKVEVNVTLTDGEWHDLHLHLDAKVSGGAGVGEREGGWRKGTPKRSDKPFLIICHIPM